MTRIQARRPKLVIVGGAKGGTGKTVVTLGAIDYYRMVLKIDVIVVETDTTNPDVAKCFRKPPPQIPKGSDDEPSDIFDGVTEEILAGWRELKEQRCEKIDLTKQEGWFLLVDLCQDNADCDIIVNTKGGNADEVKAYGPFLDAALEEIPHELTTFWVFNLYRDSLLTAKAFRKAVPKARIHALLNECWGSRADFDLYDGSMFKQELEAPVDDRPSGQTVMFPAVANRILKKFFNQRQSLEKQMVGAKSANRTAIIKWRAEISKALAPLL